MKKLLSTFLAVAMIVTLFVPMMAQAAETITLSTTPGESVLIEAENYATEFTKYADRVSQSTAVYSFANNTYTAIEPCPLSGGKALFSGSFSNETSTLTFPVSADKDTIFTLECGAGYVGHLNQNYWTLDGATLFYTSTTSGFGTGMIGYLDKSANYPIGTYSNAILIPAGTHELTYVMPKRTSAGGAFALDYVKLTATDMDVPTISWKEEPTVSAKANGKIMAVTFTDSAVETLEGVDTPVIKYQIEIYPADATTTDAAMSYTFNAYTGDKKDADGNVLTRPTNYTAHIPLSNIMCGTFYAKVFPLGITSPSMKGEAFVSDTFTVTEDAPGYANRYELDEYWKFGTPNLVRSTKYGSGGKILSSFQGGAVWTDAASHLSIGQDYWQDTYDMTFEVDLPKGGVYDIETVMGKNGDGYVDLITVSVDDSVIYTNAIANASEQLHINGNYSWSHLFACRYNAEKELSAGKHIVKFSLARPTVATQPHLFMLDYIQFTPEKPALSQSFSTTLEMEDYAANFIAYDEEGNTVAVNPGTNTNGNVSGGKFITKDTSFTLGGVQKSVPVKADIPVTVREAGYYTFEVIDSYAGCDGYLTITTDNGIITIIDRFSKGVVKEATGFDSQDEIRANFWTYYNVKWHGARLSNGLVYLPEGEHILTVHFNGRTIAPGASGMAFCIDNVKVTPAAAPVANIATEGETFVEIDEYTNYFLKDGNSALPANVEEHAKAHNGKLATIREVAMATGHDAYITVNAEKAGWYDMGSVMSINNGGWTSLITLSVNDEPVITGSQAKAVEDLSKTDGTVDYVNSSYLMHRFSERVYLNEGENKLTIHADPRSAKTDAEKTADEAAIAAGGNAGYYRVGYYIDYVSFAPVTENIVMDGTSVSGTVVLADGTEGKLIVAAYNGKGLVGTAMYDAAGEAMKDIAVTCSAAPDTVKVFLWSDLDAIAPVELPKIFNK